MPKVSLSKAAAHAERENAKAQLVKYLPKGATAYTILRHVSTSGMQRRIDVIAVVDNEPRYLSGWIARLGTYKLHRAKQGLIVNGCGMDMGFDVVYNLAHALYGEGYALKQEWL